MSTGFASIQLDTDRCAGCTNCTRRCPTEAIRVVNGKATILQERCVDCGECIRVCPRHVLRARVDLLEDVLKKHTYNIALPDPVLYSQFSHIRTRAPILEGLRRIGFDRVFEVSAAAEVMAAVTHDELYRGSIPHPVITTACPVILHLVRIRFPALLPHLLHYHAPMEVAARWSRRLAVKETGLPATEIGCVFISPCPALCSSAKAAPAALKSAVTDIVSISEVAARLTPVMGALEDRESVVHSGAAGVSWAFSSGQARSARVPNHLAASGMENIIGILEALEDGKLSNADLIELNACYPGCVGGALTVENPSIAMNRLLRMTESFGPPLPESDCPMDAIRWERSISPSNALRLDSNVAAAMEKMERIRRLAASLPGIDCAACGSPSCRAFAEDVVTGRSDGRRCVLLPPEDNA